TLDDSAVSLRYHFGQLRLTRLNYAIRLYQPRSSPDWWYYHETYWHTGAYVERFFAPLLFIFGSVAIVLTAMQVVLAVPEGPVLTMERWTILARASWGFSVALILVIVMLWLVLFGGIVVFTVVQVGYGAKVMRRHKS